MEKRLEQVLLLRHALCTIEVTEDADGNRHVCNSAGGQGLVTAAALQKAAAVMGQRTVQWLSEPEWKAELLRRDVVCIRLNRTQWILRYCMYSIAKGGQDIEDCGAQQSCCKSCGRRSSCGSSCKCTRLVAGIQCLFSMMKHNKMDYIYTRLL
jgi:hypothetical protein